nr:PREDICTED: ectonucleoside triphosphate diphosphohydrolase 8-like isoform X1 [Apteryx mantelli mantelli]XP_013809958.1 PREDICTED: ectonucleoside triphosphate diphosphohydrolase 8-like isoform X2 [Apteryx mantelli mantelli]
MSKFLLKGDVRYLVAVLALLGIITFFLILAPVKDTFLPPGTKYGLVFDAGSTHTALYIYQWPADKENDTGIVSQVEACTVPGPGISSYADNPALAGASLKPCLDKAMMIVPAKLQRETPTYLGATAGMRLLREQNSTKADQVFAEVAKAIRQYPVDFRGAQILTGNEEGSFGWITVNYLLETLIKFSFAEKWERPQATEVLGALDLGGASTQITFQPGGTIEDKNTSVLFRLYGTNYSLYTHSYLCYGQTQALKRLLAALREGSSSPLRILHPCYPKGYQENTTTAALYDSPCVPTPSTPSTAEALTVTGTGDPVACRAAIQKLFNFTCGAHRTCGFNGIYQPPVRGQFFAFSGLYYDLHFLNLTRGQSLSSINATIWDFCARDWEKVQKEFPDVDKTYLRNYCAASSYVLTLLLQGYKFNDKTWPNIHFIQKVANTDVGWTLGYMLNLTNMIPLETSQRGIELQRSNWTAATITLLIMLFLCFWLFMATCHQRKLASYETF